MKGLLRQSVWAWAILAVAAAFGFAQMMQGQGHAHGQEQATTGPAGLTPQDCQALATHHEQMKQWMRGLDEELDRKVEAMGQSTGNAKVGAMEAVVKELVDQRKQIHEKMAQHRQQMMGHMAGHVMMGMNEKGREAMMQCPMMQQKHEGGMEHGKPQGQTPTTAPDPHAGHQH